MDSILTFLQNTPVTDWVLLIAIIFFAIIGFFRGGAKIIIHSIWWILGLIIASMFYQNLANLELFTFITYNEQGLLFTNFIIILVAFMLLKLAIYKLLAIIAKIHGPCPLNKFIALVIGFGFAVVFSWYITMDISSLEIIYRIIVNDMLRIFLTFLAIFTIVVILVMSLAKLLNIKVGIDRPCPLLVALQPLDGILNAKNINSTLNNIEGMIFSIIQGLVILITFIIINNHLNFIDINYNGSLQNFEEIASFIQNILSDYLLFINKI